VGIVVSPLGARLSGSSSAKSDLIVFCKVANNMPTFHWFMKAVTAFFGIAITVLQLAGGAHAASRLEAIKARGYLNCGVGNAIPGFSLVNDRGQWSGLDVEFCSALAASIFGKRDAVKFRNLTVADRFKALQEGEVDVLMRATAWTLTRDVELGARFAGILFHDGQGFLVPRGHAISSVLELSGASVCVLPGSSGERGITDFFGQRKMRFQLVTSESWEQLVRTYAAGGCTVLTGDISLLAAERSRFATASENLLLPELISKEPLGPLVKTGDEQWFSVVRWSYMALLAAEEFGLTSANVDAMRTSSNIDVRRFLGLEADLGAPLGLARDWAYQIVKQVGSYAEVFDRTLGSGSPLKLERGLNALWTKGGLMYAAPLR
jgi:general L-amino acid transport system substrate-binding protein